MEQTYSTSRAAKRFDVHSVHAGAKHRRKLRFDLASLHFPAHLSGSVALLCSDTGRARRVESPGSHPALTADLQAEMAHLAARYRIISPCP